MATVGSTATSMLRNALTSRCPTSEKAATEAQKIYNSLQFAFTRAGDKMFLSETTRAQSEFFNSVNSLQLCLRLSLYKMQIRDIYSLCLYQIMSK